MMGISKVTVETVYCDRCGSEKDTRNANEREWGHTFLTYKGNTGGRDMWGNGAGTNHKGEDIYICLPCTREFLAWLDKPKKDIKEFYTAPPTREPLSDEAIDVWCQYNNIRALEKLRFQQGVLFAEREHGIRK